MSHELSKNDPLFYKTALKGLIADAKENGVTVTLQGNRIAFDDRMPFMDGLVITTKCSIELEAED